MLFHALKKSLTTMAESMGKFYFHGEACSKNNSLREWVDSRVQHSWPKNMRESKCQSMDLVPLRGTMMFGPRLQNRILIPFRGSFQKFRQSPQSPLYGRSPLPPSPPPPHPIYHVLIFQIKIQNCGINDILLTRYK